jgi:anti-sigma28 factor (negative regulator of flagellin synthesis)
MPKGSEGEDCPAPAVAGKRCAAKKAKSIRTAVASGNYRVEAKEVAGKIVDDAVREIRRRLP